MKRVTTQEYDESSDIPSPPRGSNNHVYTGNGWKKQFDESDIEERVSDLERRVSELEESSPGNS